MLALRFVPRVVSPPPVGATDALLFGHPFAILTLFALLILFSESEDGEGEDAGVVGPPPHGPRPGRLREAVERGALVERHFRCSQLFHLRRQQAANLFQLLGGRGGQGGQGGLCVRDQPPPGPPLRLGAVGARGVARCDGGVKRPVAAGLLGGVPPHPAGELGLLLPQVSKLPFQQGDPPHKGVLDLPATCGRNQVAVARTPGGRGQLRLGEAGDDDEFLDAGEEGLDGSSSHQEDVHTSFLSAP